MPKTSILISTQLLKDQIDVTEHITLSTGAKICVLYAKATAKPEQLRALLRLRPATAANSCGAPRRTHKTSIGGCWSPRTLLWLQTLGAPSWSSAVEACVKYAIGAHKAKHGCVRGWELAAKARGELDREHLYGGLKQKVDIWEYDLGSQSASIVHQNLQRTLLKQKLQDAMTEFTILPVGMKGRPKNPEGPTFSVSAAVSTAQRDFATDKGNGNISHGLRIIIDEAMHRAVGEPDYLRTEETPK